MKKFIVLTCLAIGLGFLLFYPVADAEVHQTVCNSYTFSFYCPPGEITSGSGQSDIFNANQDGNVNLWIHEWSTGGAIADNRAWLLVNGTNAIGPISGGDCTHGSPISVVTSDDLRLRSEITCVNGPAGTATIKTVCIDAELAPIPCNPPHSQY